MSETGSPWVCRKVNLLAQFFVKLNMKGCLLQELFLGPDDKADYFGQFDAVSRSQLFQVLPGADEGQEVDMDDLAGSFMVSGPAKRSRC